MKKRVAIIDRNLCRNKKCGYHCMRACPINRSGEECIVIEDSFFPLINEELCIGCSLCVKKCDKLGYNAIMVVNLPKELEEGPVHRYGANQFSLFRLPIPRKNIVTGLIGPNGIGKTTVLNILSGNLKPNLGSLREKPEWHDVIQKFRGSELQEYLELLSEKGLKIGYKPQHVDLIPNMWKGKVETLLKKSGRKLYEISERLGVKNILDKQVKELSGGELQLLAIISVLIRDCDFYFFDEPSSYLDVKQRLSVAKEIRKLSREKMVMVVEHDLAILDYLSDHVHILYGKPGAFGVISKPYGVRVGINTYLEGYVKEDNVRFREKPITFSKRAGVSEKANIFTEFSGFEKGFPKFSLKTENGDLNRGEIIGVLGPNSTGKTTFIKMLIGDLKPDTGKPLKGLKLSYKPQRLVLVEGEGKMTVNEFLDKHVGEKLYDTEFKRILTSLGIERSLNKKMGKLSGGELQSVFISSALGKEHDILLLDEPSAFLDVEQRLNMAKVIRVHIENFEISGFVVDHDLQVIDAIADRIMVFEGVSGKNGFGNKACSMGEGMNKFLRSLDVTFRRDPQTGRPRANKPESQKDREQKEIGEYYYSG